MTVRSSILRTGLPLVLPCLFVVLSVSAGAESARDLLSASEGTPGLGSLLGGADDDCAKAEATLQDLRSTERGLSAAKERLAAAEAAEKNARDSQKQERATADKRRSDAETKLAVMRKGRVGKKFGSALELKPEKDEFLRELEADIRQTESAAGQFGPGFGRMDCPRGTSAEICGGAERDRRQLLGNLNKLFAARLKLLRDLKACVNMSLRFFECRPANVGCPASGIMNGVSLGGARAEFDRAYKSVTAQMKLSGDGDICRLTREAYEARLREYRKKYEGAHETPEERTQNAVKSAAEAELARLDAALRPALNERAAAKGALEGLKSELAALEREYAARTGECAKENCSPEINVAQTDWTISAQPEMPPFTATSKTPGEWTFQASWHYNEVHCDYPERPKSAHGIYFDPVQYSGGGIFGGKYSLKFDSKCKGEVREKSESGVIRGMNPDRVVVMLEIKSQLDALGQQEDVEIMEKIVCQESRYTQFRKSDGMPYACNEKDIGLFQVRDVSPMEKHCRAAWDWKYNVSKGIEIYGWKKEGAKNHHKYEMDTRFGANSLLYECIMDNLTLLVNGRGAPKGSVQAEIVAKKIADSMRSRQYQIAEQELAQQKDFLTAEEYQTLEEKVSFFSTLPPPLGERKWNEDDSAPQIRLRNEAIRRYNKGREYSFVPTNFYTCEGIWQSKPKLTDNIGYVEESLSWDPNTCR